MLKRDVSEIHEMLTLVSNALGIDVTHVGASKPPQPSSAPAEFVKETVVPKQETEHVTSMRKQISELEGTLAANAQKASLLRKSCNNKSLFVTLILC